MAYQECQTNWIKFRTDRMSVLIWVQTVCKGYRETTKVVASKERVLTISVMSGSSGLGSAISSCIEVSTVLTFKHGFHPP